MPDSSPDGIGVGAAEAAGPEALGLAIGPDGEADAGGFGEPHAVARTAIATRAAGPRRSRRWGVARRSRSIAGIVARRRVAGRWALGTGFHVAFLMAFPVVVERAGSSVHVG